MIDEGGRYAGLRRAAVVPRAESPAALSTPAAAAAASSGRQVVGIAGERDQRQRFSHLHAPALVPFDLELRGHVGAKLVAEAAEVPAHFGGDHLLVDLVVALERRVRALRLPVGRERPDQLLGAEILGHADREQERVASRIKMGRLPLIGTSRFDVVVGTDRDVELFQPVRVHVPEEQREGSVLVRPPPLVRRRHTLARRVGESGLGAGGLEQQETPPGGRAAVARLSTRRRPHAHHWLPCCPPWSAASAATGGAQHSGQPMS